MKKFFITLFLLIVGVKYGMDYLLSEKFQKYGDKNKAQWTCNVNNFFGGFYETMSEYEKSIALYKRVFTRCPDTPMMENALLRAAYCADTVGKGPQAVEWYQMYLKQFPEGQDADIARKNLQRLHF